MDLLLLALKIRQLKFGKLKLNNKGYLKKLLLN